MPPNPGSRHEPIEPQSRRCSAIEAIANIVLGFMLAMVVQALIYPMLGITTNATQNGMVACVFTAVSFLRSYAIRRLFVDIEASCERQRQERARRLELRLA